MKRIASIVFILLLAFIFPTCKKKKDLPKNIPDWLQSIIEHEKKESRWIVTFKPFYSGTGPRKDYKMLIEEHTDGSSIFYHIYDNYPADSQVEIYNYDGVKVCAYYGTGTSYTCSNYHSHYNMKLVRIVFDE